MVAGCKFGERERGEEVADTGSKGGALMPKFWCTEKLQHGRNGSRIPRAAFANLAMIDLLLPTLIFTKKNKNKKRKYLSNPDALNLR